MKSMLKAAHAAVSVSVAILALGGVTMSAQAEDARIHVGDLNLNSPEGRAQFDARVTVAASRTCSAYLELDRRRSCMDAFREAADENLSEQQMRLARQEGVHLARR